MSTTEDLSKWLTKDNIIIIMFALLFVIIFYVNVKVNDIDYRLRQTIMYHPDNASKWRE